VNSREISIALLAIIKKECFRFLRIWPQTLLPSAITTTLYFLIFGKLVGSRIGDMNGLSYLEFIAPGLIMMTVITNSYANVSSSFFSSKFQKFIEEMLVSPMPNWMILGGFLTGGCLRGMLCGSIVTGISFMFLPIHFEHPFIALFAALACSWMFSAAGFLNGLFAKKFDDISIVPTFVLTPLTYLGGVFYSVNALPELWKGISFLNPILYMINIFRFAYIGFTDVNIMTAVLITSVLIFLLTYLSYRYLAMGVGLKS
jgi:ABC-2 type transport system permease protein